MIVDGEFSFRAPRNRVWVLLQDPDVLVKAMPGAQRLVATGDGTYEGTIRIGVGPVTAAQWTLSVALHDREEPARYTMKVDSKGPLGFTRGNASVELLDGDGGSTTMRYRADLQIGGKVAGIGQRLLDQVAKLMTRQGLEALSREMELRIAATVGSASASFGIASGTVVDGEVVADDAVEDAAEVNPESGDAPDTATLSDAGASSIVGGDEEVVVIVAAEDADPAAEAPLAPGVPDAPAPIADLDQDLPPGTIG
ncbi:MAG: carbon monoxide dehydrogenase subunit G [Gemmatimonadetes bacterium]|nr:carbon monoxide dehydrogenase subunit G [Gemmatimonadota bacterium]